MKKSIFLIGFFLLLAAVALVYAIQRLNPSAGPLSVHRFVPGRPVTSSTTSDAVQFEWKLGNPYLLKNGDGSVFLDLRVTGKTLPNQDRKRMNLVLVVDRSGSMGSENKLEQVKSAAAQIINHMNASDRLAVVIYDDSVQTLIPSSSVENKEHFKELIAGLSPGGSTNLCGGLMQGFEEARRNFSRDHVNRIVLLSDGLANAGIIEPDQIAAQAKLIRENSVSVSSMGVGIDYNESLMANIADSSGGNYYYISSETNMAEIFRREWNLMQSTVASGARITMGLREGIDVIDVAGFQYQTSGNKLTIEVPDISSGESKRILVQLRAPAGTTRVVDLGTGSLTYTDLTGSQPKTAGLSFHPSIRVVDDRKLVVTNNNREVAAKAASVKASRDMEDAYRRWEEGDKAGAYTVASSALEQLNALGYVANERQVDRYNQAVQQMSPAAPEPPMEAKKDFMKRQKEAERNTQQTEAQ